MSPDDSPVLRGAELSALPVASLISAPVSAPIPEPEPVDDGPDIDALLVDATQRGYEQGVADAEVAVRQAFQQSLDALDLAARDLAAARSAWETSGPAQVVGVALEIAEMILMREVKTANDPGRDAIVRCLTEIANDERAVLRLNPSDLDRLSGLDELLVDRSFELIGDDTVAAGDAVADTTTGSVDARLRSALGRVREELLR